MAATIPENVRAEMQKAIPWRRFGQAQEVADAVLFLCSPLAGYITGHTLASRRRLARLSPGDASSRRRKSLDGERPAPSGVRRTWLRREPLHW